MFALTVNTLQSGAVICPYTHREAYNYLQNEDNLRRVNQYVGQVDKRVVSPTNGGAFFLVAYGEHNTDRKTDISTLHKKILTHIRPMLQFLELCMEATRTDATLQPGDTVNVPMIVAAIDNDTKLQSDLQDLMILLPRGTGITNRERFDSVVKRLEHWGYLVLQNSTREIYQVTGQLSVFQDVLNFFIEHTPGAADAVTPPPEQGTLF